MPVRNTVIPALQDTGPCRERLRTIALAVNRERSRKRRDRRCVTCALRGTTNLGRVPRIACHVSPEHLLLRLINSDEQRDPCINSVEDPGLLDYVGRDLPAVRRLEFHVLEL